MIAIHDLEDTRTIRFRPSGLLKYFCNESINQSNLIGCLDAIAQKVRRPLSLCMWVPPDRTEITSTFLKRMSGQVVIHSLPPIVAEEVCRILIGCTHRFQKVRETALNYARRILETFSALLCDRHVVFTLLEILTLLRRSCELQYTDEVRSNRFARTMLICGSIRQYMSFIQTKWNLPFTSLTTTRFETRSPHSFVV